MAADWREELHPRDARGRFVRKGTKTAVPIAKTLAHIEKATDDDLFDLFHRIGTTNKYNPKTLAKIDAELARREGLPKLPPPTDTPEQTKLDDLVRRGYSYADAYADVYNKRVTESTHVERRAGEPIEKARRRAYAEVVALEALQAEEATRGNLVSKRCPGVHPELLWNANPQQARKCASEDLKRWWEGNGGRHTYRDWKAGTRGHARETVTAGQGRDFGV